jgi:ABC-type bacteriocin/lantibiotic exporter with double-glycine peptidase domain
MVTHRQSVVDVAEDVLVVDAGRVVQQGRREEVVGSGGAYDLLWEAEPVRTNP